MIICHCAGISDKQVRELMQEQGITWKQALKLLQVGQDCGGCLQNLKDVVSRWIAPVVPASAEPLFHPA